MTASLRARVTLGLAAITLALAVVAGAAVAALARLGGAVDTILRENYRSVVACEAMKEALERQDSAALFALTGHAEIGRPMLATHRDRFARAFAVEAGNVTLAEEGPAVRELDARYRAYTAAVDRALSGGAGDVYFRELLPRFTGVKEAVQRILDMNHATMEQADRRARAMARRSTALTLAVGACALVAALWMAWRLPGTILAPVRGLARAARAVGDGDLEVTVADAGVAELEPLAEAFRKMVAQLRAFRRSSLGELMAARDLADATVRCLLDPVVVFSREGEVLLVNEAAAAAFGLRAGDGAEVPEGIARVRDEALATARPVTPRSLAEAMRWRDRAGERHYLVRAAPLRAGGDARAERAVVVAQDVTRLRRIDALKSDMVATVSHEFKTPLTSLRMATHLLLEPAAGPLTDAQREIVTAARDDTERLRSLVDELLDLVRIESEAGELRRVPVAPRHLLQAAADAHRALARDKGVALTVSAAEGLAPAEVDPEKMAIVLANLVSNAVRHTPAGGEVALEAADEGASLRFTIRDSGEGVEPGALARMFERGAHRPTAPGGGRHGLGLTIAQEIVLQHGGEIRAASEPGRGSAFTVLVPRG